MLYIANDHRGYELKKVLLDFFKEQKIEYQDLGTDSEEPADYPEYAKKVAEKVLQDSANRGILICGTGAGMTIAANKIKGIYAALAFDAEQAKSMREHGDINILVLAADYTDENIAKNILQNWLNADFDKIARHQKRIDQIKKIENKNF